MFIIKKVAQQAYGLVTPADYYIKKDSRIYNGVWRAETTKNINEAHKYPTYEAAQARIDEINKKTPYLIGAKFEIIQVA